LEEVRNLADFEAAGRRYSTKIPTRRWITGRGNPAPGLRHCVLNGRMDAFRLQPFIARRNDEDEQALVRRCMGGEPASTLGSTHRAQCGWNWRGEPFRGVDARRHCAVEKAGRPPLGRWTRRRYTGTVGRASLDDGRAERGRPWCGKSLRARGRDGASPRVWPCRLRS